MEIKIQNHRNLAHILFIALHLFLINISIINSQKCIIYDFNLNKIAYNNNYNSADSICSNYNKNENSYCEATLSSCACRKNYSGENCEIKIQEVNLINSGISTGDFTLLIVVLVIVFPLILIIGLFLIFFICRKNPNNIDDKKLNFSYSKRKNFSNNFNLKNINNNINNNQNVIITNDIEKKIINSTDNADTNINVNFTQLKTDNTNIMLKRDFNPINNITENNITTNKDYNFKYSDIPLSTERKDDNMLITLRNNTEIDNDTSAAYKRPGIENLNRITTEEYERKFDEIEEFTSQFKTSLQENFSENEYFMNFIEGIFTNTEHFMNQRDFENKNRTLIQKIKEELKKVFNKLTDNVPNGNNYLKANNFYAIYQDIFIRNNDTNIIEEDNSDIRNNMKRSNFDISFNNDKSGVYNNRDETLNVNQINLEVPESSRNMLHTETSYLGADNSKNEILESKFKPHIKKAFAIKSVQITKSPMSARKNEEKNVELSNNNEKRQHQRNESKQSNSNKNKQK